MRRLIFLFVLSMSNGFLLQTNSPLNSGAQIAGNQLYITKSELYDTQNQLQTEVNIVRNNINLLQNDINFVRNDMNKKLDLLTSQLQQMLASFQQQLTEHGSHNNSNSVESLEVKYNEVMGNYTKLQEKFDSLQIKYSTQEIELHSVRNETKELKDEIVNLNSLRNKQEIELQSVKNKTKELVDQIVNLNSLKTINQLTDLHLLQHEVQSIAAQTHSLAVNEQARIQDFQALYNSLKDHEANEGGIIQGINASLYQKIQSTEITTNATLSHVNNEMKELEKSLNLSFSDIRQQIEKNSEKVALTACAESSEGTKQSGEIIKYGDVRTQVNVNNLSSFRSSGKFTCEKEGLYLVSAWDMSNSVVSDFSICKNGKCIANAYIGSSSTNWYTATAVVAVELLPNETIWVQTISQMYVYPNQRSCLTIVKVQ